MSDHDVALAVSRAALGSLERNRRRIDDLNVYPVPDGDTGTNMTLTVRAVVETLEREGDPAADRASVARFVARAALLGGRGNSGVILSVIVRGVTDVLGEADTIDAKAIAAALRSASDLAYSKVSNPVEGTMLTATRVLAETAEGAGDVELPDLLRLLVERGDAAVLRTQEQLDVLRDAGVVDAGAAGLLEAVRGIASHVTGEPLPEAPEEELAGIRSAHQELSRFRYCTGFVVEGERLDAELLERELAPLGDSLLVVGDETALKVHVHTDDPGRALQLATAVGVVEAVEVANMHRQTTEREDRLLDSAETTATALVAVSVGEGNRRLFESSGATVVDGGETMNPSTEALLRAIEAAPGGEVVVLPNNPNVFMAADEAASLAAKPVHVVRSGSIQAGLAAAIVHDASRPGEEDAAELAEAVEEVAVGAVTVASRPVEGVAEEGDFLGLVGREPVVGGKELAEVAEQVVEALLDEPHDLLTVLTGADDSELDGLLERLGSRWPELEVHVHDGGQPHYRLLLSAE
ncbi:MAG TPA: DAK2 domain-containing protein [Gaiellaceae bacterium]|nr:DAK2 domain-containing protein [Gaiellaceae bacterium]